MIDFSRPYYVEYYNKMHTLKDLFLLEFFNEKYSLNIAWDSEDYTGSVLYGFKKFPFDMNIPLQEYTESLIEKFANDDRIMAFSKIIIPPKQKVGEHVDTCYWPKEFFRAHVPLMDTKAIFYYGDEEINWKRGEIYFFDVRHIKHGAKNDSDEAFEFISIDICVEDA